jgi:ATP-binding cassette subfamily F protein 3
MSLAVFESVSLSYGAQRIVEDLDLRIGDKDRIGLVGPNGSGKSSLLRMLGGVQEPDHGRITVARGVRVGWLAQDIELEGGRSLLGFVLDSVPGRTELRDALAQAEAELTEATESGAGDDRMMELGVRLADLHERALHHDEWFGEHEALRILGGLGFAPEERDRDVGELSGGWRMRAALAAILFQRPELLLLDEPTNHLDLPSVAWFSEFLRRHEGAFILVCHDREFLNEQIDRVVSFEVEGVRQYRGDYEHYRRQREEEEIVLANAAKNQARERERAERFIERFRAQANKARAVRSRVKQLERIESIETRGRRDVMRFDFPPSQRAGAEVITVEGLHKRYGDHRVLTGVDARVRRGDRVGMIGVNGAGKTTLLRIMAGEIDASAGEVRLGHNVTAGYFAQHHAETLDASLTAYEVVLARDPEASPTRIRAVLGAFCFGEDEVDKRVRVLSGGERARLALARLLVRPGNLLLMDEPTNHLDLDSSESLAATLGRYDGTLVFVSHNRSFIRALATRIWDVDRGNVEEYPGTLDEYLDRCRRLGEETAAAPATETPKAPTPSPSRVDGPAISPPGEPGGASGTRRSGRSRAQERARKRAEAEERRARQERVRPLQKRVDTLEAEIDALEGEQTMRNRSLADPALYDDAARRDALLTEFADAQARLDDITAQWEVATAELEAAQSE